MPCQQSKCFSNATIQDNAKLFSQAHLPKLVLPSELTTATGADDTVAKGRHSLFESGSRIGVDHCKDRESDCDLLFRCQNASASGSGSSVRLRITTNWSSRCFTSRPQHSTPVRKSVYREASAVLLRPHVFRLRICPGAQKFGYLTGPVCAGSCALIFKLRQG